jgi:hypothetical protein
MHPTRGIFRGLLCIIFFYLYAQAADPVAVIVKTRGRVDLFRGQTNKSSQVKKGQVLYHSDKIRTRGGSFCAIKFIDDKSLLRVKENSTCIIEGTREEDHINKNIVVEIGSFFASLFRPRGQFTVTTPTSVASVKGTQFWIIQLEDGRTFYIGIEDLVDLLNNAGPVLLRPGQTAIYTSIDRLPEIRLTQDGEIPLLEDGFEDYKSLEIEFKDGDGRIQKLRIDYQEQ